MAKKPERRIAVRFAQKDFWLFDDLVATAKQSGWDLSKQIRTELASAKLEQAKTVLLTAGLAHCVSIETGGRPRIVWRVGAK